MLEVRDVHAGYGESMILQGVSLQVGQGQVATVLGRNGVGKTTLIRAIGGLIPVRRGAVVLKGFDTTAPRRTGIRPPMARMRSEEHTSELQSQSNLVCRLLLEKK